MGDGVDLNTFKQILEMDEPGDNEFSSSIVFGFFEQAEETFGSMDTALYVPCLLCLLIHACSLCPCLPPADDATI